MFATNLVGQHNKGKVDLSLQVLFGPANIKQTISPDYTSKDKSTNLPKDPLTKAQRVPFNKKSKNKKMGGGREDSYSQDFKILSL